MTAQYAISRGRAVELRDRARSGGFAGFPRLAATIRTERHDGLEFLEDTTKTRFQDEIAILGEPTSWIPIGTATFPYHVVGSFTQPSAANGVRGECSMSASFEAAALTADSAALSRQFPSLLGPQRHTIQQLLLVTVVFWIGEPFSIGATLNGFATERKRGMPDSRLSAVLDVNGTLEAIIVEGVEGPQVVSASGTQYYVAPDARSVRLLGIGDVLRRH